MVATAYAYGVFLYFFAAYPALVVPLVHRLVFWIEGVQADAKARQDPPRRSSHAEGGSGAAADPERDAHNSSLEDNGGPSSDRRSFQMYPVDAGSASSSRSCLDSGNEDRSRRYEAAAARGPAGLPPRKRFRIVMGKALLHSLFVTVPFWPRVLGYPWAQQEYLPINLDAQ